MQRAENYVFMPSVSLRAKIEADNVFIKLIWRVCLKLKMCSSSWRGWSSMRRMIPNWEIGSQYPQYHHYPQYPNHPQYPQWGGGSKIEKLVPNILNILKEEDDPKLGSWFPISVFDWDSDALVDIRPTVTDNHDRDDHNWFWWLITVLIMIDRRRW